MRQIALLIILLSSVTFQALAQNQNSVEGDRQALVDLYNATGGGNWSNNSGWLSGNPSNSWHGVEVNSNGRVVRLDLYKNNLEGALPSSIGNLTELRFLSLKGNSTLGEIPESIANWTKAEVLLFASDQANTPHNEPKGPNHHPGKNYYVSKSKYTGSIPDVFDKMPNLRILQIAWQENLDEAPFPSTLYQHPTLEHLQLQGTRRIGTISDKFNLPELQVLFLGSNEIEGQIPSSLGNSTKIINMKLNHSNSWINDGNGTNKFSGSIPDTFANFTQIQFFFVSNHDLSGEVPAFVIDAWGNLREIGLDYNNFEGTIPPEFGDKNLTVFFMGYNNFSGELDPNLVSGMPNVVLFDVRGNNLSGGVHPELWRSKTRLRGLNLAENNFSGPLPEAPDYVGDTAGWRLYRNNFTGGIPDSWENFFTPGKINESPNRRDFTTLQIHGNSLEGVMPDWFTAESVGVSPQVVGNKWTHRDVLENNVNVGWSLYPNQPKPFGEAINQSVSEGSTFTYDYSDRVHSTDQIQWTKNGNPISGATTAILTINNFSTIDEGEYRLELTNNGVPPAGSSSGTSTIVSEPIVLRIGEPGGDTSNPPGTPVLSSPPNGSSGVSISPLLSWNSVSNAASYRLQVSETSEFSAPVISENGITGTQRAISGLEYEKTYYWRVRAVNSDGVSDWSTVRNFTTESDGSSGNPGPSDPDGDVLPAPGVQSPADGATDVSLTPAFEWSSVEGADSYILHVSASNPSEMVIEVTVEGISFTPETPLVAERNHQWRVRGVKDGVEGEWSPIAEFTTQSEGSGNGNNGKGPQKATPAKDEKKVKKNATFTWETVEGAESYTIEIRESATSSLFVGEEVTDTVYVSSQRMKGNTEYTWRVRATIEGQSGDWSDEWAFTTEEENEETIFVVELDQNYPNPFNPSTNIRFTIAEQQEVSLKVYDMAGRLVASLVDGNTLSAGTHSASFNAQSLASGIYFYRLITPSEIVTRKMTLMK